ncbi:probable peroxisomal acyl-coenzyme A oxidase 1 [Cydia amplana]|uniref:probable peroxisomal acyl-coenzyme A oxidase 1 n=1 Tax=Cydia amplana TaxID=1869771 RepID=UPI002FE56F55
MAPEVVVNEDLLRERKKCNFNIKELTYIIDGGRERTEDRRNIESIAFKKEHLEVVNKGPPEECLSLKERYEKAIEKSCLFAVLFKNFVAAGDVDVETIGSSFLRRTADAYLNEQSPFAVHLGMFVTTILGQGTPDQQAEWLPSALDMQIVGTYAQTELGHGTFIRGLETTATYDPETEQFVLHTPTLSAHKWWPGGLGKTANHAVVIAQLYTKGECHGTQPFIVQIRDRQTHMPLPGIRVGEIGPRMGYINADNGFLGFDHVRIPRENMLMKNAQVLKDGTYVKKSHKKMTYGTMVFIRVILVSDAAFNLAKAVTIAVRYSAVRRQCQPNPDAPEPQILDYITQQHKLFIGIATAHALQLTSAWLWTTFAAVQADMREGNVDNLPELHALSSCLKALSTSDSLVLIEQCRFACGGHGYMLSSRLPTLYGYVAGIRTNEGDYTILMLQCARFLVKAFEQTEAGNSVSPTVSYLSHTASMGGCWDLTLEGIVSSFQRLAKGKISAAVTSIRRRVESGMSYEDAWQLSTIQLVAAAEAHCRAVICSAYWSETQRLTASSSANVRAVMQQLASLYITYWALERTGDLLRYCSISENDIVSLQQRYEELLALIRPNAVGLVDAFDITDEILQSTLGAYDGRVYERLMAEAEKTPLNSEPVNKSFHTHFKRFMQGKL